MQLAQVTNTFLRFFEISAWKYTPSFPFRTPIQTDFSSTLVILENGRLFCGGGGGFSSDPWNVAYLLSRDGAVEELPVMLTARRYHGVIQVLRLYVFGGSKL